MANPFLYSAPTFDYYPSKEHVPWQSLWFESSEMFLPETEFFPIIDQPLEYLSIPSVDAYAMGQPSEPYTGYHDSLVDYTPNDTYDGDYGALDPHYEPEPPRFTNNSPREGVDKVLTINSSQEQLGPCTELNDEAIVSEDLPVGESQNPEVVNFRFRQWKNHGERHKAQRMVSDKKKTSFTSQKRKMSDSKKSSSTTPIKRTRISPVKRHKLSVLEPDPHPQVTFTQLQATAQAPMLNPSVTLSRGGRLPQSVYIHETGRTEKGQIRRIRACGFE